MVLSALFLADGRFLLGEMPDAAEYPCDVGVSYGLYGVAAAALYFLPRRTRLVGVLALSGYIGVQSLIDPGLAASGHILSLGIGLGWWLVWRRWPRTAEKSRTA
jgi:hypothetical protein